MHVHVDQLTDSQYGQTAIHTCMPNIFMSISVQFGFAASVGLLGLGLKNRKKALSKVDTQTVDKIQKMVDDRNKSNMLT